MCKTFIVNGTVVRWSAAVVLWNSGDNSSEDNSSAQFLEMCCCAVPGREFGFMSIIDQLDVFLLMKTPLGIFPNVANVSNSTWSACGLKWMSRLELMAVDRHECLICGGQDIWWGSQTFVVARMNTGCIMTFSHHGSTNCTGVVVY